MRARGSGTRDSLSRGYPTATGVLRRDQLPAIAENHRRTVPGLQRHLRRVAPPESSSGRQAPSHRRPGRLLPLSGATGCTLECTIAGLGPSPLAGEQPWRFPGQNVRFSVKVCMEAERLCLSVLRPLLMKGNPFARAAGRRSRQSTKSERGQQTVQSR